MPPAARRSTRGFWPFIALQAQGAFSDNVFKQMMLIYVAKSMDASGTRQELFNATIGAMYILPALIFSCWAGFIADKFSKRSVTLATKCAEIAIMTLGVAAMSAASPYARLGLGLGILFLVGTQFTFFGPSKYGILPELVQAERLSWANGILEMMTFVSIILGVAFAALIFKIFLRLDPAHQMSHMSQVSWILVGLAAVGLAVGGFIDRTAPANPSRRVELNFLPELMRYFQILRGDRTLSLTVLGLAYFWGLGSMLLIHVNIWGEHSLGFSSEDAGLILFSILALGIGLGSGLAGSLSHRRIELGLVPLGGIGMTIFSLPLGLASPDHRFIMIGCLFLVGASAGFFSVPLNALLQQRTDLKDRGGLLAASNYVSSVAMLLFIAVYAGLSLVFAKLGMSPHAVANAIFLFCAGLTLIVSNHVSFIDAVLLQAVYPRPVRFVVWEGLYRSRVLGFLLRTMRCIPVAAEQNPRQLLASLRECSAALTAGEVVGIFAEGEITRTGLLLPIQRGYEYILKNAPAECPVLPVCLDGLWGSIFSFERGKFFWKRPRSIPYPVRMAWGRPLPATVKPAELRQTIEALGAEAALAAGPDLPPLHHQFIRVARRRWREFAMIDLLSPPITRGQSLWRSILLARRLGPRWDAQETVGVLLPPSVGAALVNYAAALSGRTTVNLNYTTGQAVLESCARRAGLQTIVTSRAFLEKVNLEPPAEAIYLEDYRGYRGVGEILGAMCAARWLPLRRVERYCQAIRKPTSDTLATIIFSSGSTGEPKGVMLSHFNIAANVESVRQGIRIWPHDRLLGTLPFFHSFGYTVAMWGSALAPFGAVWHMNPLDVKLISELCAQHGVTLIITTPTFLQHYVKRVAPGQLGGLSCVITGAERLPERLREAFLERFGIEPMQGYGTTECAPVVACNVDDFRSPGFYQVGHKHGSIGHPLPGIAVRVVDPESGRDLPPGEAGVLMVRGANVMQGYLGMPEKTAEVLKEGWYNTGDVARIDEDGFIFITDRLSRFSKIGGEMVPHMAIEEKLHAALAREEQCLVVTGVPDEKKGEQLVVLHTLEEKDLEGIGEKLAAAGLPNLWIPRRENFRRIEAIPLLGTGKLDLAQVRRLALERAAILPK